MIFEGEFLYNWRIKGKEYNLSGTLIYEGEYSLNQKYNGKGFDKNGNIIYEIVNGKGNYKEFFERALIISDNHVGTIGKLPKIVETKEFDVKI